MFNSIAARLSAMMFLQFFMWGAWYVTAPRYLSKIGFDGGDFAWTYSVGPLAALLAPLFLGMVADRFFPTERVLGVLHLLGGGLMLLAAAYMDPQSPGDPNTINLIIFAHTLCYFPTLALTNSLAMHHVTDATKTFPLIRVFGTIGWIVAGVSLTAIGWGDRIEMFYLTAATGAVLGLYCFTLPHTPPPAKGQKTSIAKLLGADALVLFKNRSFSIFIFSSFLICIPLAFYYQLAVRALDSAGISNTPFVMTWGQGSEIFFMVLMPFFFRRLGVKWMLLIGMLAWTLRYALFAIGTPAEIRWMMIIGVVLHGICYDFFFVTGQIYTDQIAPKAIRAQAQGLLAMLTIGLGMLIGAQVAGRVEVGATPQTAVQLNAEVQELGARIATLDPQAEAGTIEQLTADQTAKGLEALRALDWRTIWMFPALLSAIILLLFAATFKETQPSDAPSGD